MEREAFARLIEKYRGQMFFLARAKLGDEALAGDAVQDACEKMWRAVPRLRFENEEKARRYLVIAVTTAAIDLLRAEGAPEVVMWDERRTTIDAHRILRDNGKREKKHKNTVDAVDAALILEGYLGTL